MDPAEWALARAGPTSRRGASQGQRPDFGGHPVTALASLRAGGASHAPIFDGKDRGHAARIGAKPRKVRPESGRFTPPPRKRSAKRVARGDSSGGESSEPSAPDFGKSTRVAIQRLCDAAAIELARLELTFGAQAVREEMLYPALTSAVASRSISLWPEVSIRGQKPKSQSGRRSTKWIDFVLLARASMNEAFSEAIPVEVKIAKHIGGNIRFRWDQLLAESSWRLPNHVAGERFDGCLVVVVLRLAKDDAGTLAQKAVPRHLMKRLPEAVHEKPAVAQSTVCGETCSTTAMAFWFSKAELTRGAANSKFSKDGASRARKGVAL